ncbi:MAG: PKD domain-containing protein, partial [Bacteroidia bacterium]
QSSFAASYAWAYSNGQSDTTADPTFDFTNTGIVDSVYLVRLIVTNLGGCTDTATDLVRVYPNPTTDFVATPANGCGDLAVTFSNQSTPNDTGSISIMSFEWDLGNGSSSTSQDPSSNYLRSLIQDSVYTITLIGSSEHGCRDTISKTVRVFPQPLAEFSQSDTSGCGPLTVSFQNTSIPHDTGSIADMNFQWNFGNGFVGYDRDDTITFYPALVNDTVYTVRLIAFSEHGCRDTAYSTVRVNPTPLVDFSRTPTSGCSPLNVAFTSTTTNIATYFWDFGNGDTSTLANPSAVFNNVLDIDTVFTITLSGESQYGCPSDSATRTVIVRPDPVAAFTQSEDSVCGTTTIVFSNASTGANAYAWDFGDGSTASNTHPQHSYSMNPLVDTTYTVRLVASSFHNCRDTALGSVTIFPFPTAVIVTDTAMGCNPLTVNFSHTSLLSTGFTWDFGNGSTSTSQTPSSVFTNSTLYDTLYSVELLVSSVHGCVDSTTATIRVFPDPTVEFVAQPTSGCGDLTVNFTNQSTPNDTGSIAIMTFNWDLGNGSSSTATNPSSLYLRALTQDSIYTVELIGTSEHGCRDSVSHDVRTFPKPLADFTQSDTSGCGPLTVSFTNLSIPYDTGSINDMSFFWDFGNGLGSTNRNDSMEFNPSLTQDTVYTIRLIALSEHGCRDTMYSTVRVHPDPNISFSPDLTSGCGPLPVQFSSTVLNVGTYYWDFGDGDTSHQANPLHSFQNRPDLDTSYTVRFWAQSSYGCWSDTVSQGIIVRPDPVANFSQNLDSLCGGGLIQYSNNSTLGYTYQWDFGDGSATTIAVNPQHTFVEVAFTDTQYPVQLIATSVYGCGDTLVKPTTIFPLPDAQISFAPDSGCSPLLVNFGNQSTIAASHSWTFGDNSSANGDTLQHLFTNPLGIDQDFQVIMQAVTVHGCIDRDTVSIRVHPLPRPNFVFNKTGVCDTSEYNFSNLSAGALIYEWDFGDGTGSFQDDPSHIYPTAVSNDTTFVAKLIATTNRGCVDSISKPVTVTPIMLARASTNNASGCPPLAVDFVNNSTNATSFYCEFDDGFVSTSATPSHTFINPDQATRVYSVQLIVSNNFGCADTAVVQITVAPNIDANFAASKTGLCTVAEYNFVNLSVGSVDYQWDFGDGSTSTQNSPTHIFPTSLTQDTSFIVRLVVRSSVNCFDTIYRTVTVHPIVTALFTVDNNEACGSMLAQFTNLSRNGNYHVWDFGDGSGTAQFNPSHSYFQIGTYYPSIVVYDAYGCSATYTLPNPIIIWQVPQANFVAIPTTQRLPNATFDFTNLSIAIDPLTYSWDFGDPGSGANNSSSLQDPQHTYSDSGTYVIRLIVDNGHCRDTIERTVRLEYYFPIASFRQNPDTGCMEHTVTFINESQYATSYRWFFGDGGQSTDVNPTHTYVNPGIYTVSLIAYGPGGVDDTTKIDQIVVVQKPYANFYVTPFVAWMPNTTFTFVNTSILATSYIWDIESPDGNDITTTDENPILDLNAEGEYSIRLIAINAYGCRDTA